MPPQQPIPSHKLPLGTLFVILVLLVAVALIAYGWYIVSGVQSNIAGAPTTTTTSSYSAVPAALQSNAANYTSGNYAAALQQVQAFESSTTVSAADKASFEAYNFGTAYRASGNINDLLSDIDKIKTDVVGNTALYGYVQAEGINEVATSYAWMGENPLVYAEIFKGPTFQAQIVTVTGSGTNIDPNFSIRSILEYSMGVSPSSMAAGWIAGLDGSFFLSAEPGMPASVRQYYVTDAESSIKLADQIEAGYPSVQQRPEYVGYRFWEAFAYGALAEKVGGTYEQQYKTQYQNLITFISGLGSVPNEQWLPYADYFYAVFLVNNDNDTADAQTYLQKAVDFVKADPNQTEDEFKNYVRNKEIQEAKSGMGSLDFKATELYAMANISPSFKAFMTSLQQ